MQDFLNRTADWEPGDAYVAQPMFERGKSRGWWVDGLGQFDTEAEALTAIEEAL